MQINQVPGIQDTSLSVECGVQNEGYMQANLKDSRVFHVCSQGLNLSVLDTRLKPLKIIAAISLFFI